MKITAIRMAEFRKFRAPIALEGLSGGLDILSGPNELGKSTILTAATYALTIKFNATGNIIEGMKPYSGGTPTVEMDFQCDGRHWRLLKRWSTSAQKHAELQDLSEGGRLFHGVDAEEELAKLLANRGGAGQVPLLWVKQTESVELDVVPTKSRGLLDTALAGEVAAMTGSDRARLVRQRVQAELDDLETGKYKRPRSAYLAAITEAKAKAVALAEACAKLDRLEDQLRLLATTRERERAIADPVASAARQGALERARDALAAGQRAKAFTDQAAHERRTAQSRHTLAQHEHAALEATLAQLADLDRLDAADAGEAIDAATAQAGLIAESATHQHDAEALSATITALQTEHAQAVTAHHQAAARSRLPQIAARLESARAAAQRGADLTAEVSTLRATAADLETARHEAATLRDLETRLSAAAAVITVDYAAGAVGRIRVGGRDLADGDTLTADRALVLDIEGIGTLTVRPGGGEATEDTARLRDVHRGALERLCAAAAVTGLADFEARVATRRRLEAELSEVRARLQGLAPEGIAALETSYADARTEAGEAPTTPTRPLTQIDTELNSARATQKNLAAAITKMSGAIARLREADAGRAARLRERALQREQLTTTLPPAPERATRRSELALALTQAETAANDAARTHSAWLASAPDDAALARLTADVATAQDAIDRASREVQELNRIIDRAEGLLVGLRNEDIASVVAELTDAVAEADAVVRRFEVEVAALRRLEQELASEAASSEAQFLEPIKARFFPYLHLLFPGADAQVDATFGLRELARSGATEHLDRLSDGTREQIAVLARLAFARLLADSGRGAPVILDDALVFADDDRMLRLFRALEEAANWHQVIVLTCHEKSFADLAGHRVTLQAWERVAA